MPNIDKNWMEKKPKKWDGELAKEGTLMAEFQKERTAAINEMFDNVDENGIYPTTKFFGRLDNCVDSLLSEACEQGREEERNHVAMKFVEVFKGVDRDQTHKRVADFAEWLRTDNISTTPDVDKKE